MSKLKTDDQVIIIAGKDKGRRGMVTRVLDEGRVYVSGVNMIKKHTKGNPQAGQPGGIIEKEASIEESNVAIFNSATSKKDKIGYKILEDGKKVRIYKSTGDEIDG